MFRSIKFCLAGVINTIVDWSIYYGLIYFLLFDSETLAKAIGAVGGITSAYILNSTFVFNHVFFSKLKEQPGKTKLQYIFTTYIKLFSIYSIGMAINVLTFSFFRFLYFPRLISLVLSTSFSMIFNYHSIKIFIFAD